MFLMQKYKLPWNERYRIDPDTGCWNWLMSLSHGAAQLHAVVDGERKTIRAYRFAWEQVNGPIPPGVQIRHDCDNAACVNPDHLRLGTQLDNVRDMDKRKRANRGYTSKSQLTSSQVRDIRFRLEVLGDTLISVARDFEMSRMQIRRIRDRQAWARID